MNFTIQKGGQHICQDSNPLFMLLLKKTGNFKPKTPLMQYLSTAFFFNAIKAKV